MAHPYPPRDAAEDGFSILETCIAIVLMGFALVGVVAATRLSITTSSTARSLATVERALDVADQAVLRSPFVPCPTDDNAALYQEALDQVSTDFGWSTNAIKVVGVEFWDPATGTAIASFSFPQGTAPACPASVDPLLTPLQRIRVQAVSPDGIARNRVVVKSNDY